MADASFFGKAGRRVKVFMAWHHRFVHNIMLSRSVEGKFLEVIEVMIIHQTRMALSSVTPFAGRSLNFNSNCVLAQSPSEYLKLRTHLTTGILDPSVTSTHSLMKRHSRCIFHQTRGIGILVEWHMSQSDDS